MTTQDDEAAKSFTRTSDLVLIETSASAVKRASGERTDLAILVFVFFVGLSLAVRHIAKIERTLAAEGANSRRVIVYELDAGKEFRVPIEPKSEVFRIVAHLVSSKPLAPHPHTVRLQAKIHTDRGDRQEDLVFLAPWTTERVAPEDQGLVVGDPIGVNLDVHDAGVGELSLGLQGVEGADGLLVRVYRREAVSSLDSLRRRANIDPQKREHLARRAGELDWVDLDDHEQIALVGARWKKVAALSDSNRELVSRAIALGSPPARPERKDDGKAITLDVDPAERVAFFATGPVTAMARVNFNPDGRVFANVRDEAGSDQRDGKGELTIDVPAGKEQGVELGVDKASSVSLLANDPSKLELPSKIGFWRATPARPAILSAGQIPIVVRTTVRRAVARDLTENASLGMQVTIARGPEPSASKITRLLPATAARSDFDRYDVHDHKVSPTEKAVHYLVVPAHGVATLTPTEGELDLSFSELDPQAEAMHIDATSVDAPRKTVVKVGESDWKGFVTRRPSNAAQFETEGGRGFLRVARRLTVLPPPNADALPFRVRHPTGSKPTEINGSIFEPANLPLGVDVGSDHPVALVVRLFAPEKTDVVAIVDGGTPERVSAGVAERVTVSRSMTIEGEMKAVIVLGDDLKPGPHTLSFVFAAQKQVFVHAPWVLKKKDPKPPKEAHWVAGDFD